MLLRREPARSLAALAALAVLAPLLLLERPLFLVLTGAAFWVLAAIGLDLLMGYTGLISLGYASFVGIGAYVSGLLSGRLGWPVPWAMGAGVAAAVAAALAVAPVLRLQGFYFAVATLGIAIILGELWVAFPEVTGGPSGLTGIPPLAAFGVTLRSDLPYFLIGWAAVMLGYWFAHNLVHSGVGRALIAIHDDPLAARSMGVDLTAYKVRVWLVSAAYAGVAGVLFAHYYGFVSPTQFGVAPSIMLLVMVILGGARTLIGPILGALLVMMFPGWVRTASVYQNAFFGVLIILLLIFLPHGLMGGLRRLAAAVLHARD